jgi:chromosome segregation ATPase
VYVPQSPTPAATLDRDELIAELRARIEDLRTDRDAWRDQARRSDYMASTALERTRELESRLRELEAPADEATSEARESPEAVEQQQGRVQPQSATGGAQGGAQRRPWWKRVFRG